MSEPIWPVPTRRSPATRCRPSWAGAATTGQPHRMALIDFFGMREARDGWDAESVAMQAAMDKASKAREDEAERIIAECGPIAREHHAGRRPDAAVPRVPGGSDTGTKATEGVTVTACHERPYPPSGHCPLAFMTRSPRSDMPVRSSAGFMSMSAIFSTCEARVVSHRPTSATDFAPAPTLGSARRRSSRSLGPGSRGRSTGRDRREDRRRLRDERVLLERDIALQRAQVRCLQVSALRIGGAPTAGSSSSKGPPIG